MKTFPVATSHIQFKRTMHLIQSCATVVLALALGQVQAQVFIPSTYERDALNALIPGIVDGAGVMDTLNPGIAQLDTVNFYITTDPWTLDVEFIGLRYLSSMTHLSISGALGELSLNGLPSGLKSLVVYSFGPINLNALPSGLEVLWIGGLGGPNPFTAQISSMPDSLHQMMAMYVDHIDWQGPFKIGTLSLPTWANTTFSLPHASIDSLYLGTGGTASVDLSQAQIHHAFLDGYHYSHLAWPSGMTSLHIRNGYDSPAQCLPWLPEGLARLELEYMGYGFCMPNWPISLNTCTLNEVLIGPGDVTYCSILNSACPGIGSGMSGHAFVDLTGDGQFGLGDAPFLWASISTQANAHITGCASNGYWYMDVQPGSYEITASSSYPYIQSISPAQHFANLVALGDLDTLNDFAVTLLPNIKDLQVFLYTEPARPGFDNRLYLTCRNYGTVPIDAQLVFNFGPGQTWVGSSVPPSSQGSNTATWALGSLAIGSTASLTIDLHTASNVPLGTPLNYQLTALPIVDDEVPSNNMVMPPDSVVGSYDPNDKLLSPAMMTPAELQTGAKPITYTIRFQNTGTYLAQRVVIVDTLPNGLQTASIQVLASSHAQRWYVDHGVLYVIFQGINLPDSTSDALNSQGFVRFSILPETDLPLGATITNIAHIVFDFNAPIITPPAVFHVDDASAVAERSWTGIRVYPNPVQDQLWVMHGTNNGMAAQYAIKDLSGRDVLNGKLGGDGAVNVGHLRAGSYTITTTGKTGVFTTRFMKL